MRPGEIVLIRFLQADLAAGKLRPHHSLSPNPQSQIENPKSSIENHYPRLDMPMPWAVLRPRPV